MADNNFKETVGALFEGIDSVVSAKTVVGEAIHVGDTIVLPLVDISFGMGAGSFGGDKKENNGGGVGGKVSPNALLVISNGTTKLVSVKNTSQINKIIDMVPDIVNKFMPGSKDDTEIDLDAAMEEAQKQADKKNKEHK